MKKIKPLKKSNTVQVININKNKEKDVVQSVGSFHDFLIMEKKDKIKENTLEFQKVESDNNFLKDFLFIQRRPNQEKSRFTDLFKEIKEQEEKKNLIEEPKIEENEKIEPIMPSPSPQSQNMLFDSHNERNPSYFSISQYQMPNQKFENINYNNEKKLHNNNMFNFSNTNSRSTSDSGFTGHGSSFSIKSSNTIFSNFPTSNLYKRNSMHSTEGNIMNNHINNNNINNNIINNPINNNIINNPINNNNINNNIINNNIINSPINNNMNNNNIFNLFPNNIGSMNIIYNNNNSNNNNHIEKEFEPNVDMKKVLTFEDNRTTIMIKNIPNKFTREKLLELIDKNFKGTYDLFILPKDGNKNRNFGYSFINFISSYSIPYFYSVFNGKKWIDTNSQKVCEITYSKYQGRNELISHYPNKIIFFNDDIDIKNGANNNFFIPNEYKSLFKQLFPNQQIEEKEEGFVTKIPFCF